jgi:MFS transporter, FSR family, fosmidomycin resistance protein
MQSTAAGAPVQIRPMRSLWLVTLAHAFNHAQVAVLPLVYLAIIEEWGVTVPTIAFMTAATSLASGLAQLSYSGLTRRFARRSILGVGNAWMGVSMIVQGLTTSFPWFAAANVSAFIGASQQHPVGNGLLSEQFPPERRGFAISSHIAGGNVGTVAVPLIGAWLIAGIGWGWTVVLFGIPPLLMGIAILALIREAGTDRIAAIAHGSLRDAFGQVLRDRDIRLLLASSMLGGGARGLGVLNLFIPLYLALVLDVDTGTIAAMMTVLLLGSVPGPIVAGWLSDRVGRKPMIIGVYLGGAAALVLFVVAGSNLALIWVAVILLAAFSFVESPQLQALLADIARPALRDASFSIYFTLAFGVGAMWTAVYGAITGALGDEQGLPVVFGVMALAFLAAAAMTVPIRAEERAAQARAEELALIEARRTARPD